jgi:hypothetical protein
MHSQVQRTFDISTATCKHWWVCRPPGSPSVQPSARNLTVRADQKPDSPAVSREGAQNGANEIACFIVPFDLDCSHPMKPAKALNLFVRRDASRFLNCAIRGALHTSRYGTFRRSSNIRATAHPGSAGTFSRFTLRPKKRPPRLYWVGVRSSAAHHLIPLIIRSGKISVTG